MTVTVPDVTPSDDLVRRLEPALWLASRLAPGSSERDALVNLYAVHIELGRIATSVTTPLAGEIRLAWWRDEVEAMAAGVRPPGHPALRGLLLVGGQVAASLQVMIEGRHAELEAQPFSDQAEVEHYFDNVDGGLLQAACAVLDPTWVTPWPALARALGWRRLLRERAVWRACGRDWASWSFWDAISPARERALDPESAVRLAERAAYQAAKKEAARAPVRIFPAIASAALPPPRRDGVGRSELEIQMRLIWAAVRGRI